MIISNVTPRPPFHQGEPLTDQGTIFKKDASRFAVGKFEINKGSKELPEAGYFIPSSGFQSPPLDMADFAILETDPKKCFEVALEQSDEPGFLSFKIGKVFEHANIKARAQ